MSHSFNTAVLLVAALLVFSSNIAFGDEYPNDNLNIEAQPLASALREFSEQTGLQLGYAAALAEGKRSNGVEDIDDPAVALDALLDSTGLEHRFVNDDTVVIRAAVAEDEGGSDPGKAQPTPSPALMAQASAAQKKTHQNQTSGQSRDAVSTLYGTVRGFVTEAYLAGALVTIVETSQSTSTDELGNYRFPNVAAGSYTLHVSFLGLTDGVMPIRVSAAQGLRQDFVLTSRVDEIVVYGSRSARALALNRERTSENVSTVISADLLGSFTGTTISDVLRRAPGVSFQRDVATGEGTNIIVRGLSPDFNAVQLNGLNLPVGSGLGRAPDLSNLLVDSVDSITINKTLLPSHDSAGTGGLIQIETKSPLGRAGRTASFTVESGRRSKDFADDFLFSGIVSGVFGESKNFGLSASVQYREATNQTISYSSEFAPGLYLPLDPGGGTAIDGLQFIDPRLRFPFEDGNGEVYTSRASSSFSTIDTSTLAATLSGEWQVAEHTRLQLDIQRTQQERDSYTSTIAIQATAAAPFPGGLFGFVGNYQPLPVQALNGEIRQALSLNGGLRVSQNYIDSPDAEDITDTISFRGETEVGKWRFDYAAGYADGSRSMPRSTNAAVEVRDLIASGLLLPAATDAVEGRVITPFGPRRGSGYPLPLLSEAGWAFANDPANYDLAAASSLRSEGRNERISGKFSTRYDFDNTRLKYFEAGVNFETSEFTDENSSITYLSNLPFDPLNPVGGLPTPSLAMLGLGFSGMTNLSDIGISRGFETVSESDIRAFLGNIDTLTGSINSPLARVAFDPHPLEAGTFTRETELAVYFQGRVDIGRLEIIGGVRLSDVEVDANRLVTPQLFDVNGNPDLAFAAEFTQVAQDTATVTSLLPRLLLNFRKNDNVVFRGGYFLSVARPQIFSLSSTQIVSLDLQATSGPGFNRPELSIQEGNPGLKPARTHNLDVSMEIYNNNIGVIKVGGFYKRIDNLIESNSILTGAGLVGVNLPDHPAFQNLPQNVLIRRTRPENNDSSAYIWGVEAHVERQFSFLPGFWDGLGVFANYTYSKSSKDSRDTWVSSPVLDADGNFSFIPDPFNPFSAGDILTEEVNYVRSSVPFDQQPEHSGTVAITYNKYNIDTALTYGFQSQLRIANGNFGFSRYNEATETLDFRVEYLLDRLAGTYRIYLEATDLLKGSRDVDLETSSGGVNGVPRITTEGVYLGGRAIKLGVTSSF